MGPDIIPHIFTGELLVYLLLLFVIYIYIYRGFFCIADILFVIAQLDSLGNASRMLVEVCVPSFVFLHLFAPTEFVF